jgi:putative endonuclease
MCKSMLTVYVLYSEKFNKMYIGFTSDLEKRFLSHNEVGIKGWTKNFRPWKIIHTETFETKVEAMSREKQLKTNKGRESIRKIINAME